MANKLEYALKHNRLLQKAYIVIFSLLFRLVSKFVKKDKRLVLLSSLKGKSYGDSPKVLYLNMRADPRFEGYRYVWAFDDPTAFDVEGADKVKLNSIKYFITSMKAGIWVTNVNIERGLRYKPKGTVYINTWHGAPLKCDGNAQKNRNDYNFDDIDMMCSCSELQDLVLTRDFKVRSESIVRCGMPRNDELFKADDARRQALRAKYDIPEDKRVILYAPTWRESTDKGRDYCIAPPLDIDYLRSRLASDYVILFRAHHLTTKAMGLEFDEFVRDCSGVPSINELLIISDILISDYSATVFDYCILRRPILLFAYDYEEYMATRGLYQPLEKLLPGNVYATQEELADAVVGMDYDAECAKSDELRRRYMNTDGTATRQCLEYILEHSTKSGRTSPKAEV